MDECFIREAYVMHGRISSALAIRPLTIVYHAILGFHAPIDVGELSNFVTSQWLIIPAPLRPARGPRNALQQTLSQ